VWLVTGDVAGHGIQAAVVMGRIRSALQAYALVGATTADVVEMTSRKVQHFEIGSMITVICASAAFPYDHFEVASAGHPPPVIAPVCSPARLVDMPVGPPLGVDSPVARSSATVSLPEGAVMLLYTDGLVERRGEDLDVGLDRLRAAVHADDPEVVCRDVTRRLVAAKGPDDDVAMVAVRRTAGG
jgi:serine phosphatase RsbU (regulator of sigma subunit)